METNFHDDSLTLHTDLYQINMAEAYWRDGFHERKAVFELFFRKLPFGNGYAVFAGLEKAIDFIKNFRFTESDLQYLRDQGYQEDFLNFLKDLRFTGSIYSVQEGELVFPNEPLMRIEAPIAEAQLIETPLLNIINYQTLIATKASRIRQIIGDEVALEFGTRRAQEMDAAIWGTRAAYIGGLTQHQMFEQVNYLASQLLEHMRIPWFKLIKMNIQRLQNMLKHIKIVFSSSIRMIH